MEINTVTQFIYCLSLHAKKWFFLSGPMAQHLTGLVFAMLQQCVQLQEASLLNRIKLPVTKREKAATGTRRADSPGLESGAPTKTAATPLESSRESFQEQADEFTLMLEAKLFDVLCNCLSTARVLTQAVLQNNPEVVSSTEFYHESFFTPHFETSTSLVEKPTLGTLLACQTSCLDMIKMNIRA